MFKSAILAAASLIAAATTASAATLGFDDKSEFYARGDTRSTVPTPALGFTTGALSFGGLTLTRGPGAGNFGTTFNMTNALTNELAISGDESFNIDFAGPVFGFGMDVYDPVSTGAFMGCNVSVCQDTTFTATLKSGTTVVDSLTFDPVNSDTVISFFGVVSDVAFDRIEILENPLLSGARIHDNEGFANFVTVTELAPVPLPASALLLLGAVGGLALQRRRAG